MVVGGRRAPLAVPEEVPALPQARDHMAVQHDLSEYNGGSLVASACTFLFLSWVSVFLRCYVRLFMTNGFQMDDWFMLIAQVCVCQASIGRNPAQEQPTLMLMLCHPDRSYSHSRAPSSCSESGKDSAATMPG